MKNFRKLQEAYASKKRNPQEWRDVNSKNKFNCKNCLHATLVHNSLKPIYCRVKKTFIPISLSSSKCDRYIPDTTIDRHLRRILITQAYKKLQLEMKKGDKDGSSNKT